MNVLKINTYDELMEVIDNNDKVVVDFSAPARCIPCRRLTPHYEKAAGMLTTEATLVEVDIDAADDRITEVYQIQSVPTVKAYKGGTFIKDLSARTAYAITAEVQAL